MKIFPLLLWSLAFIFLAGPSLSAQQRVIPPAFTALAEEEASPGWYRFLPETKLDPATMWDAYGHAFGLQPNEDMLLLESQTDKLGMVHHRYQFRHQGIPVEGAQFLIHTKEGRAIKANGLLPVAPQGSAQPGISATQALELAKAHMGARTYMWETAANEATIKHIHQGEDVSFFPEAELMWATESFQAGQGAYQLVWKLDIYAAEPHSRKWIYIDAHSGEIVKELETLHTANAVGTAVTKYHGVREITTDSTASSFRLRETNRKNTGINIETYDLNQSTNFGDAVDFEDDDNYWDNVNAELDEAATDVHWGAEVTHDFYWEEHGRSSFDDQGSNLVSYVHYDVSYFNAFWNGQWMTYGDGNNAPLTSIDVVAHEFTHGVTGNSAGLIYAYESGALNESFSDIFGNAIEYYADSTTANWLVGEGFGTPLRNMADPQSYGDPDTYQGNNWVSSSFDNGGVHFNSGVQNYWFYLLVEGGSGINDKGNAYQIDGIGWEKAGKIAYRNLTTYLNPLSQYEDAMQGSLASAEDLYGSCSPEYIATANAWFAAGVGNGIRTQDFGVTEIRPIEACGNSMEEPLAVGISYFGCDTFPGGSILVSYFIQDPSQVSVEPIQLPAMTLGTPYVHTFQRLVDLSSRGNYRIQAKTLYQQDTYRKNDSSEIIAAYRKVPLTKELISFESFPSGPSVLDSIYLKSSSQSQVAIRFQAGNNNSYGLRMQGGDLNGFQLVFPNNLDPFDFNKMYTSRACICVDANELDSLSVSFDLRQTFSPYRELNQGRDSSWAARRMNNLRVLVNGTQLARYFPTSHQHDPFVTRRLNLDNYVGGGINLCFETNANLSKVNDPFEIGDLTFLDNIWLESVRPIIDSKEEELNSQVQLFPNPTAGSFRISWERDKAGPAEVLVHNTVGQVVSQQLWETQIGGNRLELDLSNYANGTYYVKLQSESDLSIHRIIKSK